MSYDDTMVFRGESMTVHEYLRRTKAEAKKRSTTPVGPDRQWVAIYRPSGSGTRATRRVLDEAPRVSFGTKLGDVVTLIYEDYSKAAESIVRTIELCSAEMVDRLVLQAVNRYDEWFDLETYTPTTYAARDR